MNFDRLHAYIDLLKKQKEERKIFLAHGMDAESIDEIFRADYRQLYRDAEFYIHLERYIGADFEAPTGESGSFEPMDEIESPALYEALRSLRPLELEIVLRHTVNGDSLKDIALDMEKSYNTIKSVYLRGKKKIKMFY